MRCAVGGMCLASEEMGGDGDVSLLVGSAFFDIVTF